jgi:putative nucleotidyltransferase with HDIG domain
MKSSTFTRQLFWALKGALLAGTVAATVLFARASEWEQVPLVALVLGLALLGQWLSIEISGVGEIGAASIAIVLAMGLLGPAPAAACGVAAMTLTSATRRLGAAAWLNNLSMFAAMPFAGGLVVRTLDGKLHTGPHHTLSQSVTFGLVVFGVFLLATGLTYTVFALDLHVEQGRSLRRQLRELLIPLLPGELATGVLATMLVVAYESVGLPMLVSAIVVLLIFRHLTVALLRSEERAEALYARSRQLVGLQLGVLRTFVRALGMRDRTTARHAAAVAAYAKSLAAAVGCDADEQDMIHTAGLLHDIGKFTWPDHVLHAQAIADEDLALVKRHPQDGATLVGALDGYGTVADAILHHHERMDGRGYPVGLIGVEIPLGSRVLAICSAYDTMTAGEGYRTSMSAPEAMDELRNAARNGQLDGDLVETFIALLEREGHTFAQGADFETELEFERRVRKLAQPHAGER